MGVVCKRKFRRFYSKEEKSSLTLVMLSHRKSAVFLIAFFLVPAARGNWLFDAGVGVLGGAAAVAVAPAALGALGFGAGGIAAGSIAAKWMALYGGNVAAGGLLAGMQSAGA